MTEHEILDFLDELGVFLHENGFERENDFIYFINHHDNLLEDRQKLYRIEDIIRNED